MLMATPPYAFTPSFSSVATAAGHMNAAGIPTSSASSSSSAASMPFGNIYTSRPSYTSAQAKRKYEEEPVAANSRSGILHSLKRMRVSSPPFDTPLYHKQAVYRKSEVLRESEGDISMEQEVELEDVEEDQMKQALSSSMALVTVPASKGSATSFRLNESNETSTPWKISSTVQTTFPIRLTHPDKVGAIIVYDPELRSLVPRLQVGSTSENDEDEDDWNTTSDESDGITTPRFEVLDDDDQNEIKVPPSTPNMVDEESGEAMEID